MLFSRPLKSSQICKSSPDGKLLATLLTSSVDIRSMESLEHNKSIKLQGAVVGPVISLQWSPSSKYILTATAEQIVVYSVLPGDDFTATIRSPCAPGTKPAYAAFGPQDTLVCMCSTLGLKFSLFDISTSRCVEINNPKHYHASNVQRGHAFRPGTRHFAILTRTGGRDLISVHHPTTHEVQRSWAPDTVDAQGLAWSPDGRWLVVWESPSQGHKVLFYSANGDLFRIWPKADDREANAGPNLGAGVSMGEFSPSAKYLVVGDSSRTVCLIDMSSTSEAMRLQHPATIISNDLTQVWQEQVSVSLAGLPVHTFIKAAQKISPPGRAATEPDGPSGSALVCFDASSGLLATILHEFPSTVWIWDLQAVELRAVLVFHCAATKLSWHPTSRELLMIKCDGDEYRGLVFVWDPLSEGPRSVQFVSPGLNDIQTGMHRFEWLHDPMQAPSIVFSDGKHCILGSFTELGHNVPQWHQSLAAPSTDDRSRAESPLDLVPARQPHGSHVHDEGSDLDDTFYFKK